jgi:hypothetical protein
MLAAEIDTKQNASVGRTCHYTSSINALTLI